MDIQISPARVMDSAAAVATAGELVRTAETPGDAGNAGFLMSEALRAWHGAMQQTTTQAAAGTATVAKKLGASATALKHADDGVVEALQPLSAPDTQ